MRRLFALALLLPLALVSSGRPMPAPPASGVATGMTASAPADLARTPSAARLPEMRRLPRAASRLAGPFPAHVDAVIDGDTVEVRIVVWLGQQITTRLRLRGIDAPELAATCAEERALAREARDRLAELIAGEALSIVDVGLDKYGGRVVGRLIFASGEDVGAILAQEGYARAYDGGRREGWCAPVLSAGR